MSLHTGGDDVFYMQEETMSLHAGDDVFTYRR